jgi:hypothetical protein
MRADRQIQDLHAAISRRDWHSVEVAANALRDCDLVDEARKAVERRASRLEVRAEGAEKLLAEAEAAREAALASDREKQRKIRDLGEMRKIDQRTQGKRNEALVRAEQDVAVWKARAETAEGILAAVGGLRDRASRAEGALAAILAWWDASGSKAFLGAPACIFAARAIAVSAATMVPVTEGLRTDEEAAP